MQDDIETMATVYTGRATHRLCDPVAWCLHTGAPRNLT